MSMIPKARPDEGQILLSPIPYFEKYLEIIFANDFLWNYFQMYVRQAVPHNRDDFFAYHRDPACIPIWQEMLENMGGGFPLSLFASGAFLLLSYQDQGHDLDAELEALHQAA